MKKDWKLKATEYPVRLCRYGDECGICGKRIQPDEHYRDGGYGRRAHVDCAKLGPPKEAKV